MIEELQDKITKHEDKDKELQQTMDFLIKDNQSKEAKLDELQTQIDRKNIELSESMIANENPENSKELTKKITELETKVRDL